ncbi:MAG TPA: VOC family protein [Acidimicrobiales bacterium]|nr:VOC family protein [Acidimicrobiales bacterium]
MPTITGFHHASFTVSDREKSVAWYRDVLGFERHSEVEGETFLRTRMRHPDSGITVTLTEHRQGGGGRFDERRIGLDHLALAVRDLDDLKAWKRRFEERGVDHSEIKETGPGASMITMRDPDNIQLEVFSTPKP